MSTVIGDLFVKLGVDTSAMQSDLTKAEKHLESFGTQLFFLGSRVTAGVTIPMVAAGAAISKLGLDFDKAMTESLAILNGSTPQIRADLEKVAMSVSETTKFSSEEAAKGYYHLISAGIETADVLAGALPIAARFAQAGVMDMAKSTEFLAGATAAMGLDVIDTSERLANMARVADVLTEANNRSLGTIEDFANALTNKAGAALRQTNKSVEEGVAVIMAFSDQNIKGKVAGQQLWMVMRDMQTQAIKNADAFKKYKIAVYDSTGNMKNMADIIGDVEKATLGMSHAQAAQMYIQLGLPLRSVAATKALIGYSDEIRKHQAVLEAAGGAAEKVANNQMQALWNRILQLTHAFQNAAIIMFQSFVPVFEKYLVPAVQSTLLAFKSLTQFVAGLPDPIKIAALAFGAVVVAAGPLVALIGSFTLLGAAAMRGFNAMSGALGQLTLSMGLATGGSRILTLSTAELAAAQTEAALAAIANAKAQGMNGFQANIVGAQTLKATKAAQQLAIANAQAGVSAGSLAGFTKNVTGALTAFGASIGAMLTKGWELVKWGGGTLAIFAEIYALYEILSPAIVRLFTGWTAGSGDATKAVTLLDLAMKAVKTATGLFNDVITVAAGGLEEFVKLVQGLAEDYLPALARAMGMTFTPSKTLKQQLEESGGSAQQFEDDNEVRIESMGMFANSIDKARLEWKKLVLGMELRNTPSIEQMNASQNVEALREAAKRRYEQLKKQNEKNLNAPQMPSWAMWTKKDYDVYAAKNEGRMPWEQQPDYEPPEKKLTGDAKRWEQQKDQLLGVSKGANDLMEAWKRLTVAQQNNAAVQGNLWEVYSKVRTEVGGQIPMFEKLLAKYVEQAELTTWMNLQTKNWANTWTDAAIEFQDGADNIYMALLTMRGSEINAFWKEHENTIDELIPRYQELSPKVQDLINVYLKWKAALGPGKEFKDATHRAEELIDNLGKMTAAKREDVATDIITITSTAYDAQMKTTKSKLAQLRAEQDKKYAEGLASLSRFSGKELEVQRAKLEQQRKDFEFYIEDVKKYDAIKFAQQLGFEAKMIISMRRMTAAEINALTRRYLAWQEYYANVSKIIANLGALGDTLASLGGGFENFGKSISMVAGSMSDMINGADAIMKGDTIGGAIQMINGMIKALKGISDIGSKTGRAAAGAAIGGLLGGIPGALIGGLIGAFSGDPEWKKLQKTVSNKWNTEISKDLAKQIEADADMLGGHLNAMLVHMTDVAEASGGFNASNVTTWASRLRDVFSQMAQGEMSAAVAAKALDNSFAALVEVGTTTSGFVATQITDLVKLERQFQSGSKAIKEFVTAQTSLITGGFSKIIAGTFGVLMASFNEAEDADAALEKQNGLREKAAKLAAQIADYEKNGTKNEKERTNLMYARINLAKTNLEIQKAEAKQAAAEAAVKRLAGPGGQEQFDRMARLGVIAFNAAIAGGADLFTALESIGPALDTLIAAQQTFGFTTEDTFQQLMKFRDFANLNPELVGMIQGLSDMMVGLSNLGYMTESAFMDLGATVSATFAELLAGGLTSEEAMMAMHSPLQKLWELQKKFGYEVDDSTQALIDEAVASGQVGEKYMSANDRMVLGIQELNRQFDLFLKHLGIDTRTDAEKAADDLEYIFNNIKIDPVVVPYTYQQQGPGVPTKPGVPGDEPVELAGGGVLSRPTFVAGESGAEVVMPLDRLFDEIAAMNAVAASDAGRPVKLYLDGRQVAEATVPHIPRVVRKHRLA